MMPPAFGGLSLNAGLPQPASTAPALLTGYRMGTNDVLRHGMTLDEVRRLLRGWRETLPSAVLSPDKTHLFYTIDFRPPPNNSERPLRLTFDNGKLFIWGEPADPAAGPGQSPAAAG